MLTITDYLVERGEGVGLTEPKV